MTAAISNDLRRRVVGAVLAGATRREAAERFGVAISSAVKWTARYRATGSMGPDARSRRYRSKLDGERSYIVGRVEAEPHVTLHRLADELAGRGVRVSHDAVWLWLRREGLTHKKSDPRARTGTR